MKRIENLVYNVQILHKKKSNHNKEGPIFPESAGQIF